MSTAEQAGVDSSARPSDDQEYTVVYLNGATENVTGIEVARARLYSPESRVEQAQDAPLGGTYFEVKR